MPDEPPVVLKRWNDARLTEPLVNGVDQIGIAAAYSGPPDAGDDIPYITLTASSPSLAIVFRVLTDIGSDGGHKIDNLVDRFIRDAFKIDGFRAKKKVAAEYEKVRAPYAVLDIPVHDVSLEGYPQKGDVTISVKGPSFSWIARGLFELTREESLHNFCLMQMPDAAPTA